MGYNFLLEVGWVGFRSAHFTSRRGIRRVPPSVGFGPAQPRLVHPERPRSTPTSTQGAPQMPSILPALAKCMGVASPVYAIAAANQSEICVVAFFDNGQVHNHFLPSTIIAHTAIRYMHTVRAHKYTVDVHESRAMTLKEQCIYNYTINY